MVYGHVYKTEFTDGTAYIGRANGLPEEREDYFGSSPEVDKRIDAGMLKCKKILCLCADKENLALCEVHYQIANNVDKDPMFLNKAIWRNGRLQFDATGMKHSDKTKKLISEMNKGKKWPPSFGAKVSKAKRGWKYPPEYGQAVSKRMTGRKLTEEHKKNIGIAGKGKPKSEEMKRKLSATRRAKNIVNSPEALRKMQASKSEGAIIVTWNDGKREWCISRKEFAIKYGISFCALKRALNNNGNFHIRTQKRYGLVKIEWSMD